MLLDIILLDNVKKLLVDCTECYIICPCPKKAEKDPEFSMVQRTKMLWISLVIFVILLGFFFEENLVNYILAHYTGSTPPLVKFQFNWYRSGTVNSNTVNSKFHLIRSLFEIFARFLLFYV